MTAIYLGTLQFPVLPEQLTLRGEAGHRRVTLWETGEVTQLRSAKQRVIEFSSFFPPEGSRLLPQGGAPAAAGGKALLGMLQDKKPQLFVAAGVANPISMQVTVEGLRLWEDAGDPGSVGFWLRLQEYRQAAASVQPAASGSALQGTPREIARETPEAYTVVKGDTLWGIAKRFLGSGGRYKELAAKNKLANPNLIFPGQKIIL